MASPFTFRRAILATFACALVALPATAIFPYSHQESFSGDDTVAGDSFAREMALQGDTLVVAAQFNNGVLDHAGAVYVFTRTSTGWEQEAKLSPADAAVNQYFGSDVALDGDRLVVGALGDQQAGTPTGAAYVFERGANGWQQTAKLLPPASASIPQGYGAGVAVHGDVVAVGAIWEDGPASRAGAVYVYSPSGATWALDQTLHGWGDVSNSRFGSAIEIDGSVMVVGAPNAHQYLARNGEAFVFRHNGTGWEAEAGLKPAEPHDNLGSSVDIEGDRIIIGAPHTSRFIGQSYRNTGAAFIYDHDGTSWVKTATLHHRTPRNYDNLGDSVALDGDRVAVGGPAILNRFLGQDDSYGAVIVYDLRNGVWHEQPRRMGWDTSEYSSFGTSVALQGDALLVGAPAGGLITEAGVVHVFDASIESCGRHFLCS